MMTTREVRRYIEQETGVHVGAKWVHLKRKGGITSRGKASPHRYRIPALLMEGTDYTLTPSHIAIYTASGVMKLLNAFRNELKAKKDGKRMVRGYERVDSS